MDYSFDVVSQVNAHEVSNAMDQARKEISTRYDFKNTRCELTLEGEEVVIFADDEMRLDSVCEILRRRLATRGVPLKNLRFGAKEKAAGSGIRQRLSLQQGIPQDIAKELVKLLKGSSIKVQASIQGEQLRVTGKSKDDLQAAIALLKKSDVAVELQFTNYR